MAEAGDGCVISADSAALQEAFADEADVLARQVVVVASLPEGLEATEGNVSVTLIPFETEFIGASIVGIRPEGWDDSGFGAFTAPGLGDLVILQQLVPAGFLTLDQMADQLKTQFELESEWVTRTHSDGARTWTIYRADEPSLVFDVALHDDGESLFIVALISTPDVRETYLDLVLYPALEAVQAG